MIYKVHVRNHLKLKEPVSWLAFLIRFFLRSYYNHVGIRVVTENDDYIVHAVLPKAVKINYFEWHMQKERDVHNELIELTTEEEVEVIKRIEEVKNVKYDISSLVINIPVYLITKRWLGKAKGKSKKKMTCVELVQYCLYPNTPWHKAIIPINKRFEHSKFI